MIPSGEFFDLERKDHIARYVFASRFAQNAIILDVGCGAAYGLDFLSKTSKLAVGVDASSTAVSFARHRYGRDFELCNQDACALAFQDEIFDVVISFEVIEHLKDVEIFLANVNRVLKPEGLFIVSTPNKIYMSPGRRSPIWKWHQQEFYYSEFQSLLKRYFESVDLLGETVSNPNWQKRLQRVRRLHRLLTFVPTRVLTLVPLWIVNTVIRPPPGVRLEDVKISNLDVENAETFIGVARKC